MVRIMPKRNDIRGTESGLGDEESKEGRGGHNDATADSQSSRSSTDPSQEVTFFALIQPDPDHPNHWISTPEFESMELLKDHIEKTCDALEHRPSFCHLIKRDYVGSSEIRPWVMLTKETKTLEVKYKTLPSSFRW